MNRTWARRDEIEPVTEDWLGAVSAGRLRAAASHRTAGRAVRQRAWRLRSASLEARHVARRSARPWPTAMFESQMAALTDMLADVVGNGGMLVPD